jgi:hypothetical protein
MTLRTSLLVREFRRLSGSAIVARVGDVLPADELAMLKDRKQLLARLYAAVFDMAPSVDRPRRKFRQRYFNRTSISELRPATTVNSR